MPSHLASARQSKQPAKRMDRKRIKKDWREQLREAKDFPHVPVVVWDKVLRDVLGDTGSKAKAVRRACVTFLSNAKRTSAQKTASCQECPELRRELRECRDQLARCQAELKQANQRVQSAHSIFQQY